MTAFPRRAISAFAMACALSAAPAFADTTWHWQYTGDNIVASGTLTAADAADADGFHQITSITGTRNGDAITGLQPAGSAIPGNDPYALDNLIRVGAQGQITVHGFGYATASGGFANPYFADFLSPPAYSEVFTTSRRFSEVPITFSATAVPEPEGVALMLAGLVVVGAALRRQNA
ncbi:MAG: PEP-CTERM sorting domain-containing protein [Aquabacterium sp.]